MNDTPLPRLKCSYCGRLEPITPDSRWLHHVAVLANPREWCPGSNQLAEYRDALNRENHERR